MQHPLLVGRQGFAALLRPSAVLPSPHQGCPSPLVRLLVEQSTQLPSASTQLAHFQDEQDALQLDRKLDVEFHASPRPPSGASVRDPAANPTCLNLTGEQ